MISPLYPNRFASNTHDPATGKVATAACMLPVSPLPLDFLAAYRWRGGKGSSQQKETRDDVCIPSF